MRPSVTFNDILELFNMYMINVEILYNIKMLQIFRRINFKGNNNNKKVTFDDLLGLSTI